MEDFVFWCDNALCSSKLIDVAYTPFHAVLKCGHLSSDVQAFPRPEPFIIDEEIDPIPKTINTGNSWPLFLESAIPSFPTPLASVVPCADLQKTIVEVVTCSFLGTQTGLGRACDIQQTVGCEVKKNHGAFTHGVKTRLAGVS